MPLNVRIINPDEVVYEGEALYILVPSTHGTLGIMPGHTPFYGEITAGDLILHTPEEKSWKISSGLIRVRADEVTVLLGLHDEAGA